MDAETLINEAPKTGYLPWGTIDGRILPRQLVDTFARGEQARVPLIAGFNSGEIRSLRFLLPPKPASAAEHAAKIRTGYGDPPDHSPNISPPPHLHQSPHAPQPTPP